MKDYECYTDGAYSSARDQGGLGIVILKDNKPILSYSKMYKNTTNNKMELLAVILALSSIKNPIDSFTIYSDSMYVIGCATKNWKRKKNVELWKKYDSIYNKASELCPNITFIHVKGHEGNEWNEYVDNLAVNASKQI